MMIEYEAQINLLAEPLFVCFDEELMKDSFSDFAAAAAD